MATSARDFLGTGWAFPPRIDGRRGGVALVSGVEDVRQSILIILGTAKGERVFRPEFGCGIHDLPFSGVSSAMLRLLESEVREALTRFEPRIELLRVQASVGKDPILGKLEVDIDYRVRETNARDNVVFPFYIKERA